MIGRAIAFYPTYSRTVALFLHDASLGDGLSIHTNEELVVACRQSFYLHSALFSADGLGLMKRHVGTRLVMDSGIDMLIHIPENELHGFVLTIGIVLACQCDGLANDEILGRERLHIAACHEITDEIEAFDERRSPVLGAGNIEHHRAHTLVIIEPGGTLVLVLRFQFSRIDAHPVALEGRSRCDAHLDAVAHLIHTPAGEE